LISKPIIHALFPAARACILTVGASLALVACDRMEPTPASPAQNPELEAQGKSGGAYDLEIMALKQKNLDGEALEAAIRAVQARHGLVPEPSQKMVGPAGAKPLPLEKEAAFLAIQVVKSFEFELPFAMQEDFVVQPNAVLEAWTARSPGSTVDPYLVAFYTTNAAQGNAKYTFYLAAANDDQAVGDLNPRILWKNTTGVSKTVRIMAFAYNFNSGGEATLIVRNNGIAWHETGIMRGQTQYTNNVGGGVPAGCSLTGKDRIALTRQEGGGFQNGVIAVNLVTKKGGYLHEGAADYQTLDLLDVINSGSSNGFLMGFTLDQGQPAYEYTRFKAIQGHKLICD
jgi:hypothetical protein